MFSQLINTSDINPNLYITICNDDELPPNQPILPLYCYIYKNYQMPNINKRQMLSLKQRVCKG